MGAYLAVPQACGRLAVVAMGGAGELEAAGVVAASTRGGSFGSVLDMRSLRHATERSAMRCDEIRLCHNYSTGQVIPREAARWKHCRGLCATKKKMKIVIIVMMMMMMKMRVGIKRGGLFEQDGAGGDIYVQEMSQQILYCGKL